MYWITKTRRIFTDEFKREAMARLTKAEAGNACRPLRSRMSLLTE